MHIHLRVTLVSVLLTVVALTVISFAASAPGPRLKAALGAGGACVLAVAACPAALSRAAASCARGAIGGCVAGIRRLRRVARFGAAGI
jgi:hypothetical protein